MSITTRHASLALLPAAARSEGGVTGPMITEATGNGAR